MIIFTTEITKITNLYNKMKKINKDNSFKTLAKGIARFKVPIKK